MLDLTCPGRAALVACLLDATVPKPGNVHRGADFPDTTLLDFQISAVAIEPIMRRAPQQALGATILQAVTATQQAVAQNTNLGMVLLLAPLARISAGQSPLELADCLGSVTIQDAADVFMAIRQAAPGGLDQVAVSDVSQPPDEPLLAAMRRAADRDSIARQYTSNYADVFECVTPWLESDLARWPLPLAIAQTHVRVMAAIPDTLIARKCGVESAVESAARAEKVLIAGNPGEQSYNQAIDELDFWLRSDGNRRNPGTTADLIAAGLFILLRRGVLRPPLVYGT